MARQKALDNLREYFSHQPTSNPENEQRLPTEQTEPRNASQAQAADLAPVIERLDRLESHVVEALTHVQALTAQLASIKKMQDEFLAAVMNDSDQDRTHYTPAEFARKAVEDGIVKHLEERTVRRWCRDARINATKRHGRGADGEWAISRDEYLRWRNHRILPPED